jgi:hypothetical protein
MLVELASDVMAKKTTAPFRRFLLRRRALWRGAYRLQMLPSLILAVPRRAGHTRVDGVYQGIQIADYNWRGASEPAWREFFVRVITDALRLIEGTDRRRWNTVKESLPLIANEPTLSGGTAEFSRAARCCSFDFDRHFRGTYDDLDYEWWVAQVASLLVHEAAHARLFANAVPYTRANRLRVERACHREQARFVRRLRSERYAFDEEFLPPFDPEDWLRFDAGRLTRINSFNRRFWEGYRKAKDHRPSS